MRGLRGGALIPGIIVAAVVTAMMAAPGFAVTVSQAPGGGYAEDVSSAEEHPSIFDRAAPADREDRALLDKRWMRPDKPMPLAPAMGAIPDEGSPLGGALILD